MWFKYVVKNVARKHGKAATFMPKPLFGDNGSGMHAHQSLWKEGKPLFGGDGYAGLSDTALHYIGGIIKHAKSIAGAHEPDDQLVPPPGAGLRGAGEPRVLEPQPLGQRAHPHHRARTRRRAASRCASPIRAATRTSPSAPCSWRASTASRTRSTRATRSTRTSTPCRPEELKDVPHMPGSLEEALDTLERDHEFLLRGDVFTKDAIHEWLDFKRNKELNPIRMRPTPHEFFLYFDILIRIQRGARRELPLGSHCWSSIREW